MQRMGHNIKEVWSWVYIKIGEVVVYITGAQYQRDVVLFFIEEERSLCSSVGHNIKELWPYVYIFRVTVSQRWGQNAHQDPRSF